MSLSPLGPRVRRIIAAGLAAVALSAGPASGQIGELAGFTESMQREYLSRDLVIFADGLGLDKAQQDILENLFGDYKSDFQDGLDAMQQRLQNMREELKTVDQQELLSIVFVPFEDWGRQRRQLGEEFLATVQNILNEEQLERWPAFNRRLRREKTLNKGKLSGESVNLLLVVRELELDHSLLLTLQGLLEEYEIALDEALKRRNDALVDSQAKMVGTLRSQDGQLALRLVNEQLDMRMGVRDVNDRYLDTIAAALPDEHAQRFRSRAMNRAYPKAFRLTPGMRMYNAAVTLEIVDEETRQNIADIKDVYFEEMDILSQQIVDLMREHEPKQIRNRVEVFTSRMSGTRIQKLPDPSTAAVRDRERNDDRYILMLRSILTDEEFRRLPGAERWLKRRAELKARASQVRPVRGNRAVRGKVPENDQQTTESVEEASKGLSSGRKPSGGNR